MISKEIIINGQSFTLDEAIKKLEEQKCIEKFEKNREVAFQNYCDIECGHIVKADVKILPVKIEYIYDCPHCNFPYNYQKTATDKYEPYRFCDKCGRVFALEQLKEWNKLDRRYLNND